MLKTFIVLILWSNFSFAKEVDLDLLWTLCKEPQGGLAYCHQVEQIQKNQVDYLESVYFKQTNNWQRNFLTIIYYGISGKIPIEHSMNKNEKINIFIKQDNLNFKYIYTY